MAHSMEIPDKNVRAFWARFRGFLPLNFNVFKWLRYLCHSGPAFALVTSMGWWLSSSGCLILNRHDSAEEPNYPPSIVSAPNAEQRLGGIVRLEPDDDNLDITFEFVVRDANIEQSLEYRIFLDRVVGLGLVGLVEQDVIHPVGDADRPHQFSVGRDTLMAKPCTKVEFLVAGEFLLRENLPVVEGDMDTAIWWVMSEPTVNLSDCVQ